LPSSRLPVAVKEPAVDKPTLVITPDTRTLEAVTAAAVNGPVLMLPAVTDPAVETDADVTAPDVRRVAAVTSPAVREPDTDTPAAVTIPAVDIEADVKLPATPSPVVPTVTLAALRVDDTVI
jgi:autotransporter translocation and assembly factor TamB